MELHHIRQDYRKQSLSITDTLSDPLAQFEKWLNEAIVAKVNEPTAMNIATVSQGKPSSRMVLLKEMNGEGFVFFTNYLSQKGRELEENAFAALTFFWAELERQVRVEGRVEKISAAQSDAYFASRPYTSRLGAWASEQSSVIDGHADLIKKASLIALKHPINVPRPPHWGGYIVIPERIEFWQGRPSRLHDRINYRLEQGIWLRERLSP